MSCVISPADRLYHLTPIRWEPYTSFVGSEHFVESFWARVRSERDHTLMRLFKPGEEMFPVGPPGSTSFIWEQDLDLRTYT